MTKKPVPSLALHGLPLPECQYEAAFSPSGNYLLCIGTNVTLWDVRECRKIAENDSLKFPLSVAFGTTEDHYFVKNASGAIGVFTLEGEAIDIFRPKRRRSEVCNLVVSPDGHEVFDGSWHAYLLSPEGSRAMTGSDRAGASSLARSWYGLSRRWPGVPRLLPLGENLTQLFWGKRIGMVPGPRVGPAFEKPSTLML